MGALGMSTECQVQEKGAVACWGLGVKEAVLGRRIFSHCWRKWHPSRPATSPLFLQRLQPHSEAAQLAI